MVFITIMARGVALFFRFFRKTQTGAGTHQNASCFPFSWGHENGQWLDRAGSKR